MPSAIIFVLLFSIATAVAITTRHFRAPYTVALVVVGLVLGGLHLIDAPQLTKELLFTIILPGLIFEAAFNLDAREFARNRLSIGALAVPGVVAAIGLTAAVLVPLMRVFGLDSSFDWRYGLVFGALIAATDPIAVVALFKQLNVGHRLGTLIEGESLLNDGTAVVFFGLILSVVSGGALGVGGLAAQFVISVGGGALVGAALGWATTQVSKRVDEPVIEITLTVIAAYGSFALAEELHCSGVIATVAAGMFCGSFGWSGAMSASTQLAVESFWDYVAFALNSIVFLLIGFEVHTPSLFAQSGVIGAAYVGALAARFAVVFVVALLLRPTRERIPRRWVAVLTWGGLRGALSMVLALSLPADFPHRDQLITMTVGVVLLSLLVQGLSMSWLLRLLGIARPDTRSAVLDRSRGDLRAVDVGLREIARMREEHAAPPEVIDAMQQCIEQRRIEALGRLGELHLEQAELRHEEATRAVRRLLVAERADLTEARGHGSIRADVLDGLIADADARLMRLNAGDFDEPEDLLTPRATP